MSPEGTLGIKCRPAGRTLEHQHRMVEEQSQQLLSIIMMSDVVSIRVEIGINNHGPILTSLAGVNPVATTVFG